MWTANVSINLCIINRNRLFYRFSPCTFEETSQISPWSSSRAMWTRALFLVLFIKLWSLSRQALRLASVLPDGPSSLSFSQYQSQPCSSQSTTTSRARQRPMHSSAFPWQLKDQTSVRNLLRMWSFFFLVVFLNLNKCMHPVSLSVL